MPSTRACAFFNTPTPRYRAIASTEHIYITGMVQVSPGSWRTWNQLLLTSSTEVEETTTDTSATLAGQLSAVCLKRAHSDNQNPADVRCMLPASPCWTRRLRDQSIGDGMRLETQQLFVCSS